jgi:hypothetical protein
VTSRRTEILMWLGVLAAPFAWAGSHVVGWGVSEANCEVVGRQWGIAFSTWEIVMLVLAVGLAATGLLSSIVTYRTVKGVDKDAAPPDGRLWLMSIAGMVVSSLMLAIILLTHVGALLLSHCHQG